MIVKLNMIHLRTAANTNYQSISEQFNLKYKLLSSFIIKKIYTIEKSLI